MLARRCTEPAPVKAGTPLAAYAARSCSRGSHADRASCRPAQAQGLPIVAAQGLQAGHPCSVAGPIMLPLPQLQAGAARKGLGDPLATGRGMVQHARATGTGASPARPGSSRPRYSSRTCPRKLSSAFIDGPSRDQGVLCSWLTHPQPATNLSSLPGSLINPLDAALP